MSDLPEWADAWVKGKCGCGSRLCRVECYSGDRTVCFKSGWDMDRCPLASGDGPR